MTRLKLCTFTEMVYNQLIIQEEIMQSERVQNRSYDIDKNAELYKDEGMIQKRIVKKKTRILQLFV